MYFNETIVNKIKQNLQQQQKKWKNPTKTYNDIKHGKKKVYENFGEKNPGSPASQKKSLI